MKSVAAALIALVLSGGAQACTQPNVPSFLESLEAGTSVFVFRVTSLHVTDRRSDAQSNVISGPVILVKIIKGTPSFQRVAYQDMACGGIQLIPGHYYLASSKQTGQVLAFVRGDNSVLDVSDDFDPLADPELLRRGLTASIAAHVAGAPLDKYTLRSLPSLSLHGAHPPLPPPEPKH